MNESPSRNSRILAPRYLTSFSLWFESFNSAFPLVVWIRIEWIFSWKIVKFSSYFANFLLQMSFFLPFSLRFECLIEFGWIVHLYLSFQFQFTEFSPIKFLNFTNFLFQMSFFFFHFHFDLNSQSNFLQCCISTCHFNSNSVNFLLWNILYFLQRFSFNRRFFFSRFHVDLNLQSNFVQFSAWTCHLNWNSVNFLFWNCSNYDKFSLSNDLFFSDFHFDDRISLNWLENSARQLVIPIRIQWVFSCDVMKIFCNFYKFSLSNVVSFLPFSLRFESSIEFRWIHRSFLHLH